METEANLGLVWPPGCSGLISLCGQYPGPHGPHQLGWVVAGIAVSVSLNGRYLAPVPSLTSLTSGKPMSEISSLGNETDSWSAQGILVCTFSCRNKVEFQRLVG